MASQLAARQAARSQMAPALNQQQQGPQQQGFLDQHRGFIQNLFGLGGEAIGAWNQYQAGQPQQADNTPEALKQLASGQKPPMPNLDNAPSYDKTNSQLSDTLKKLLGERIDRLGGGAEEGETNTNRWEQAAYQTAHNQEGDQPVPKASGTNFPWEQLGMSALNRLGGEPTWKEHMTPDQVEARDPNWFRNEIVGLAPGALEAAGRVGGNFFNPAAGQAAAAVGRGAGNLVNRFGRAEAPQRYT